MSGWWFVVTVDSVHEGLDTDQKAPVLASWEAPITGYEWISNLVAAGEADKVPSQRSHLCEEYRSKASVVFPTLLSLQSSTARNANIKQLDMELIQECTVEQSLTISVWDMA